MRGGCFHLASKYQMGKFPPFNGLGHCFCFCHRIAKCFSVTLNRNGECGCSGVPAVIENQEVVGVFYESLQPEDYTQHEIHIIVIAEQKFSHHSYILDHLLIVQ